MFLTIKKIPIKTWSSEKPLNFKPKFSTFFFLCLGLVLFGLGEGLLVLSATGNSPWSVFAEGISKKTDISIGAATFIVSVSVLFLWIFLKQKPGIGTVMNIIIIAGMIDVTLYLFDRFLSIVILLLLHLPVILARRAFFVVKIEFGRSRSPLFDNLDPNQPQNHGFPQFMTTKYH